MMMGTINGSWTTVGDVLVWVTPTPAVQPSILTTEGAQMIVLLSFFMFIALTGNVTVLIYLCKTSDGQRPVSIFVMSLATTDIMIAIFSMSAEILFEAFGGEWLFGNVGCKLLTYIQGMLFGSTAFILISMSYDRYEAICRPMFMNRTRARSQRMILTAYVLAAICAIPQFLVWGQILDVKNTRPDGSPKYFCKSSGYTADWQRIVYLTWLATYIFLIPIIVVAICYVKIALVVWNSSDKAKVSNPKGDAMAFRRTAAATDSVERAKIKTIKMTVAILSCYVLCWMPYFTLLLFNAWTYRKYVSHIPPAVTAISKCMAWFSSCVNPLIYATFNIPLHSISSVFFGKKTERMRLSESPRPSMQPPPSRRNTAVSVCSNTTRPMTSLVIPPSPSSKLIDLTDKEAVYDPRTVLVMI